MIFWWRRWIEHYAFTEMHERSVSVTEDLDLDVARPGHVALEKDPIVAEGRCGFWFRRVHRRAEVGRSQYDPHSLAASPGRRFHEQRVADFPVLRGVVGRRKSRHAGRDGDALGGDLVAHCFDDRRGWTDPRETGGLDG